MEQWKSEYPEETKHLERLTVTPRREDVDKFIIRKAVDAAKSGCLVKIVSNDNFSGLHWPSDRLSVHRRLGAQTCARLSPKRRSSLVGLLYFLCTSFAV